jgi:DNA-binding MarR family transcriptional regulator
MADAATSDRSTAQRDDSATALSPSLGRSVGYVLYRAFLQTQATYLAALEGELHPRELTLMARLLASGGCSQQELADCMSVNRSMMVHVIDDLERGGFVVRERNAKDRRSYSLRATGRAAERLAAAAPALAQADAVVTRRLRADQRRRVRELLTEMLGADLPIVVAPVSETVGYLVARAHLRLHARADEVLAPLGLDIREYAALQTIEDLAPCSQQQVATMLGVSGPVVVEMIDALEPRRLVVRERNAADRRSYALRLTADGSELRQRARAELGVVEQELAERLGAPTSELVELLRAMVGATEEHPAR